MNLEKVIQGCIKKVPQAEKELYYAYSKYLFGICKRYTKDNAIAKDYMQDSFIKIFSNIKKYDPAKGDFKPWIERITVNIIFNHKKKDKKMNLLNIDIVNEKQITEFNSAVDKEECMILVNGVSTKELLAGIRELPPAYQDVLNLFVFENWKHEEIAALMNIKVSSSRARLTRAKIMLKKNLQTLQNTT